MAGLMRPGSIWMVVGLRGLIMLLFGLYAVVFPQLALTILVVLGGALLLVDGLLGLWGHTFGNARTGNYWFDVIRNALSIITGLVILVWPMIATVVAFSFLVYLVALQALIVGGMEIYVAVRAGQQLGLSWPVLLSGVLYVLLAILLVISPFESAVALVILGGILMIVFSFGLFALAWRLRGAGV